MKKIMLICLIAFYVSNIFAMGGTVPAGLPNVFGFGSIDKQDPYASDMPNRWKTGQAASCWNYSYVYLTTGWHNCWTYCANGQFAKDEMTYWQASGMISVFTYYYQPSADGATICNWYNDNTNMTKWFNELIILFQAINTTANPVAIVHIEPDLLGFMQSTGKSAVKVGSTGLADLAGLPDNLQGWNAGIMKLRDKYAPGKALIAHHYTHWAAVDDVFSNNVSDAQIASHITAVGDFLLNMENGKPADLYFSDPSDRDADWFRKVKGTSTRWATMNFTATSGVRSWGKIGNVINLLSTKLNRRFMFWQMPVGNTYYKTNNNTNGHFRDNSAQAMIPSTSYDGSSGTPGDAYSASDTAKGPKYWVDRGVIACLFGEGGYNWDPDGVPVNHLRDYHPTDTIYNPTSDAFTGGPAESVWGKATSNVNDNDGGYIRNAVARYCTTGKTSLTGSVSTPVSTSTRTRTNTPVIPTSTFTRTNTPVIPTSTFTRTNTPVIPTSTFTRTNTPVIPTSTSTRTNTPVIPTSTFTRTNTPVIPTSTFTITNTPAIPTSTFTRTNTPMIPTSTFTRTNTPVIPSATFTYTRTSTLTPLPTATATNPPVGASNTFTSTITRTLIPSNTYTPTSTATRTFTLVPTFTFTNTPQPSATSTNPPVGASRTNTPVNTPALSPTFTVTKTNTAVPTFTLTLVSTTISTATATRTNTPPATSLPTAVNSATFTATIVPQATPTYTSTVIPEGEVLLIPQPPVAYPNPNPGQQVNISFDITRHVTSITVKMYTVSRRLIRNITVEGSFSAGKCVVSIDREYLIGLSKGSYLYKISVRDNDGREAKSKTSVILIQ